MLPADSASRAGSTPEASGDWSSGTFGIMFIFGVIFLIVALLLIGAGAAIGALLFTVASTAIGIGIVSSSVACGIIQRKPSAGLRLFFYQLFPLIFLGAGIVVTWMASTLAELNLSGISIIAIGSLSGVSVGLLFAALHSYLLDLITDSIRRLFPSPRSAEQGAAANPLAATCRFLTTARPFHPHHSRACAPVRGS